MRTVWFADFDGSLCPHLEVWEERSYDPSEIRDLARGLSKNTRGFFWNTGRRPESLASIDADFLTHSGYFIQGSLYWDPQKKIEVPLSPAAPAELIADYSARIKFFPKLRLEIKRSGLRLAPFNVNGAWEELGAILMQTTLEPLAGWQWHIGARGAELLPAGFDKSLALLSEMPKLPADSIPIAIGDDIMDRPAVIEALKRGGYAMLVGDSCGWITELPHKPWQVIFCDTPTKTLAIISSLLR